MSNYTNPDSSITTTDGTTFLGGLTQVEVVVVGAVGAVGLLAAVSIVLRVTMPILKERKKKRIILTKTADDKNSSLFDSSTPSSQLSSVATMQSNLDEYSDNASDNTKTCYSHTTQLAKSAALSNCYRPQPPATSTIIPTERVNNDLISVISNQTTDALEPLNLASTYRDNWDQQFSAITRCDSSDGLCFIAHPSENPDLKQTQEKNPQSQVLRPQFEDYRPDTHQHAFTKL